jgi:hypothetical protein
LKTLSSFNKYVAVSTFNNQRTAGCLTREVKLSLKFVVDFELMILLTKMSSSNKVRCLSFVIMCNPIIKIQNFLSSLCYNLYGFFVLHLVHENVVQKAPNPLRYVEY